MGLVNVLEKVMINVLTFVVIAGLIWFFVLRHFLPF